MQWNHIDNIVPVKRTKNKNKYYADNFSLNENKT